MGQEIREILKMIGEGKITAEEGERLINALRAGEDREKQSSRSFGKQPGGYDFERMMDQFGEEFGRKVESWAEGLFQSSFPRGDWERESFRFPEEELPGWGYESRVRGTVLSPEGGRLDPDDAGGIIIQCGGEADVRLVPSEDRFCRIDPPDAADVMRRGSWLVLDLREDCLISLPESLGKIALALNRGDLEADRISGELWIKTMSGDLSLTGVEKTFWAATFRGDSRVSLSPRFSGRGAVNSLKGDIECVLSPDLNLEFSARTIRGSLSARGRGVSIKGQFRKPGNVFLTGAVGEGGKDFLDLNTTGGDIDIVTVLDV